MIVGVADVVPDLANILTNPNGPFDDNDAIIVNTAQDASLPLLTANRRLPNQIRSEPSRLSALGRATFRLPPP